MLGDAIKAERERRKWSQQELAQKAGVAQTYISKLELNQRPRPDWEVLRRLASAFDIGLDDLLQAGGVLDQPPTDTSQEEGSPEQELARLHAVWYDLSPSDQQMLVRMAIALKALPASNPDVDKA